MQIPDELIKILEWVVPFAFGFLCQLLISKINEKSREGKLLRALRLELIENLSAIRVYEENLKEKYRYLRNEFDPITEFDTRIYQKIRDEAILADLPPNIRFSVMAVYHRISKIQLNYEKKDRSFLLTVWDTRMNLLKKEIVKSIALLRKLSCKERVKKVIQGIKKKQKKLLKKA